MKQELLFGDPIVKKLKEEIEIYHDETYDDEGRPFGHQFLIIPTRSNIALAKLLIDVKKNFNGRELTINWKKLRKKSNKNRNLIAENWLRLLSGGMYNKPFKYVIDRKPLTLQDPLGIKMGSIFIESLNSMSDDYWLHVGSSEERTRKKYETLLRMGIKGCLHYCFNPEYTNYLKVKIKKFYTDGEVFGAVVLDEKRILGRMSRELRDYIEIEQNLEISQVAKSKIKTPEVNFQELTDLTLGSTRYICGHNKEEWRDKVTEPLKVIYDKRIRGKGFKNSPHYRSFTLGFCKIDERGNLDFRDLETIDRLYENKSLFS